MTLKPNFIPIGSIVEYNGMINDIVGIIPPKPDKSKRFSDVWVVELSIGVICPLSDIKPIPLTPEILTEWCGFEKVMNKIDIFEKGRVRIWVGSRGQSSAYWIEEDTTNGHYLGCYEFLHELQLLFLGFKTVLPITIK
jgi:hypothetical protein